MVLKGRGGNLCEGSDSKQLCMALRRHVFCVEFVHAVCLCVSLCMHAYFLSLPLCARLYACVRAHVYMCTLARYDVGPCRARNCSRRNLVSARAHKARGLVSVCAAPTLTLSQDVRS